MTRAVRQWQLGDADTEPDPVTAATVVVVPARPLWSGTGPGVAVEARRTPTGDHVVVCFTSPARLADVLGPHQPWVSVPLSAVTAFATGAGVRQVQVDPEPRGPVDRWTAADAAEAAAVSHALRDRARTA